MKYTQCDWQNQHPYSKKYSDVYYSSSGAISEFEHVFFKNNALPQRWLTHDYGRNNHFTIAELGYGSGLNSVLTIQAWLSCLQHNKIRTSPACLHYIAIEKYPLSPDVIRKIALHYPALHDIFAAILAVYPLPFEGTHSRLMYNGRVQLSFKFMDVMPALEDESAGVDVWYMDGFSPAKNPAMWNQQLCQLMAQNSNEDATVATYSAAGIVKRNLQQAGFVVNRVKGYGKKREMIKARLHQSVENTQRLFSQRPWYSYQQCAQHLPDEQRAIIIGSGIAGLSAALSLQQSGWSVTVVDQHKRVGSAASGNKAGLLIPRLSAGDKIETTFFSSAFSLALTQIAQIERNSNNHFWHPHGCYQIIKTSRLKQLVENNTISEDTISIIAERDYPDYLTIGPDESLILFRQAGVIEAVELCRAIKKQLQQDEKTPALFITQTVSDLVYKEKNWQLVNEEGKPFIHAPVVIIASGAEANKLPVTAVFPLQRVRGQVCAIPAHNAMDKIYRAINADSYITPVINGCYHAGASYAINDEDSSLRQSDQKMIIRSLKKIIHNIPDNTAIQGRVAFRMSSSDRLPLVGAMHDHVWYQQHYHDIRHGRKGKEYETGHYLPGLYLSLGHGSRGFTTAFLAAEIITALICKRALPVERKVSEKIHPSRFIVNQLKRGH